jgi:hypothetical protein
MVQPRVTVSSRLLDHVKGGIEELLPKSGRRLVINGPPDRVLELGGKAADWYRHQ